MLLGQFLTHQEPASGGDGAVWVQESVQDYYSTGLLLSKYVLSAWRECMLQNAPYMYPDWRGQIWQ